jgi:dTDP-4-dehydrorhamnose 3,5-epimerase
MKFVETGLEGLFVVELEKLFDRRGFFARSWCAREFTEHGLEIGLAQCNVSYNEKRGTLRGLHFQREPFAEAKLVRCTRGHVYDVAVDLRPQSSTLSSWFAVELSEANGRALFVPKGFAHGFQTLVEYSEVFYQMSDFYEPTAQAGVRWNDPAFGIRWPIAKPILSTRDAAYPDFSLPLGVERRAQ